MILSKPTLGILYLEEPGRILGGVEGTLKSKGSKKENMGAQSAELLNTITAS